MKRGLAAPIAILLSATVAGSYPAAAHSSPTARDSLALGGAGSLPQPVPGLLEQTKGLLPPQVAAPVQEVAKTIPVLNAPESTISPPIAAPAPAPSTAPAADSAPAAQRGDAAPSRPSRRLRQPAARPGDRLAVAGASDAAADRPAARRRSEPRTTPSTGRPRTEPGLPSKSVEDDEQTAERPLTKLVAFIPAWVKALMTVMSVVLALLLAVVARSRRQLKQALARAHRDVLTGLPNRAAIDDTLHRMVGDAARRRAPLSVVMFDLDHFKSINDSYGHVVGDMVLSAVATAARSEIRAGDFVGRYGGEEFMLILPNTGESAARKVGEKLRGAIAKVDGLGPPTVTASFGIAGAVGDSKQLLGLVPAADDALYVAKARGRDRIECASDMEVSDAGAVAERQPAPLIR